MANDPTLLPRTIDAVPRSLVTVAREPITEIYATSAQLTIGGSGRIRGATPTAVVAPTDQGLEIIPRPSWAWTWIERGIRPHRIVSRQGRPMPIQQANAPFASGSVMHPGVAWSGAWARANKVTDDYLAGPAWAATWRQVKGEVD